MALAIQKLSADTQNVTMHLNKQAIVESGILADELDGISVRATTSGVRGGGR